MGLIPATGSAIAMGRVRSAYGLGTGATALNGVGSAIPIKLGSQIGKTAGATTRLSADFGGRTTPSTY